jgi:formamidopyrimidine-DNA glycosylase
MPELPEVEHARRRLLRILGQGKTITDAQALDSLVIKDPHGWRAEVVGRSIESVTRVGKSVLVHLSGDHALFFHLGMTGQVVGTDRGANELPRFTRWWIETAHGRACLADARRLGRSIAGSEGEVRHEAKLDELGPDALTIQSGAMLRERFSSAKSSIKTALMDQSRIAGVGNIHAAEALWLAKIHPERPVPRLTTEQWNALAKGLHETLSRTLDSMRDDEDIVYVSSGGPNPFFVYGREGEPCPRCGTKIKREVTQGRSTYLCPRCQRKTGSS